jgi:hypothetical protein
MSGGSDMKKIILAALLVLPMTSVAFAQQTQPSPPGNGAGGTGVTPGEGLGTPQDMGLSPAKGTLGGTASPPAQATPNADFPGIAGGGRYGDTAGTPGAAGGTSSQNPTNPGNFSADHRLLH